ncbi:hypothetical protein N781_08285 [Pontibacillus halophilus JSM 076056 = DSM 19796]|uniref:Inner membrane protein YgaP-like transmembrane domain-containing protein n=1 Tax=Pontibacillus halophilus JSM 076056 = DSM 19796 TaxID=1385510 RepID=A0A0A5GG81_9BACI|nr:hypothetical protein N781_08285 [Pontibacillus halophilus JSM 076056 = DSM 19796]
MRPNIGLLNAMLRIMFGFTLLSLTTARLTRRPWRRSYWMMAMIASMKIASGIVRYCPFTAMMDARVDDEEEFDFEETTFNPS